MSTASAQSPLVGPVALETSPDRRGATVILPAPLTRLIGRERELADIVALVRFKHRRLITLTGPGGVGKTRLAIRVAGELAGSYPDGVWFVSLAALTEAALVPDTIAQTLGLGTTAGRSAEDGVRAFLTERVGLLVLDNLEHLPEAGSFIALLLSSCRNLTVIATSRRPLTLNGEQIVPVAPLAVPDHDMSAAEIERAPAVRLFLDRATSVRPDFEATQAALATTAEICRHLDGLPLAIELAAARTKLLSPAALLARLTNRFSLLTGGPRDLPARQRTMRDAIAWSYDLLSAEEQTLFRRLSVFVGGFTLDAAEAVMSRETRDVRRENEELLTSHDSRLTSLEVIDSLVDNSLVLGPPVPGVSADRFLMLETLREFGLEQLAAHGDEAEARDAHAAYVLDLARESAPEWYRAKFADLLARWTAEHANLRVALGWLERTGQADAALELAAASVFFWLYHGPVSEGREWLRRLLAASAPAPTATRAKALEWSANLAGKQGAIDEAAGFAAEAVPVARASGDRRMLAFTLCTLGRFLRQQGNATNTRPLFEEALALFRAVGPEEFAAVPLSSLGLLAADDGRDEEARVLCAEALDLRLQAGNEAGAALVRHILADLARARGARAEADRLYKENLAVFRALGDVVGAADSITGVILAAGDGIAFDPAVRVLAAVAAARDVRGAAAHIGLRADHEDFLARARAGLGESAFADSWETGRRLPLEQAITEAETLAAVEQSPPSVDVPAEPILSEATFGLTPREIEILRLVAEGLSDKEMAAQLFISPRTVANHVNHILAKVGVGSRAAAVALAIRDRLI